MSIEVKDRVRVSAAGTAVVRLRRPNGVAEMSGLAFWDRTIWTFLMATGKLKLVIPADMVTIHLYLLKSKRK